MNQPGLFDNVGGNATAFWIINKFKPEKAAKPAAKPTAKPSQTDQILKHLEGGGSITAIEALNRFTCFRLAARIADLRRRGISINSTKITTESGKIVAQYSITK